MNKLTYMTGKKENNQHNHKLSAECFTKCTKWKLNATLTVNKTSTGLIFQGKGLFFKKLTTCILNNFQIIDNISEITKTTMKNIEDKAFHPDNSTSDEHLDYAAFKFPLNNADYNYLMTDCIIGDNLSNVLFLEFDLNSNSTNISKDHLKTLREINNEFVDKEIHFVLNGTVHGKPVFKNELRFNVEARKFIKSMQFRLESYKNEFIEKQKSIQRSNPNFEIKNSKFNFFSKIVSNQNIGIEFHKPNFENVEIYPTNFNSIVNSSIVIDKLFFEISIPSQVILDSSGVNNYNEDLMNNFNNFGFNQISSNKSRKESNSKYNCDHSLMKSYSNFTNLSGNNRSTNGEFYYNGQFDMEKSNSSSKFSSGSSKGETNSYYSTGYSNNSNGRHKKGQNGEVSIYDSINGGRNNYSSYSGNVGDNHYPAYDGYYTPRNHHSGHNKNKKFGKNYYERDSNSSKYTNRKYSSTNNVNAHTYYDVNSGLGLKHVASTTGNNTSSTTSNNSPVQKVTKSYSLQTLLTHYEGMCNFIIFAKSCTPYVHKTDTHLIDDIKIFNFFKNFEKVSAFGLDINYIYENEIASVNYSPTLSSMEIFISDTLICEKLIKELNLLREDENEKSKFSTLKTKIGETENNNNFEYQVNESLKIICFENKIKIEFYETKPPHNRFILSNHLEQIFSKLKSYDSIELSKIDKCSWFSVLWSPFKSSKSQFANTSFLVYYQFSYTDSEIFYRGYNNYLEIPIIGILPVKIEDNLWLSKISKINLGTSNMTYTSNLIDFKLALNDSVNNVHDFIFPNTDRTSTDYEFYLKNSM